MKPSHLFRSSIALLLCIALNGLAHSANKSITNLEDDIATYQAQKVVFAQELELTLLKLKDTQKNVSNLQKELEAKELQLATSKTLLGQSPSTKQKGFIDNEKKRINLHAMAIKSRNAVIARLKRKEVSTRAETLAIDKQISKARGAITSIKSDLKARQQAAKSARAFRIKRELEQIKKDKEKRRVAKAEKLKKAREDKARLEKLEQKRAFEQKLLALKEIKRAADLKATHPAPDKSQDQMVLPGEMAIYTKSDNGKVVIRNRGRNESTTMMSLSDTTYLAELKLDPGKSYLDIQKRRYRIYTPKKGKTATYVFTYDRGNISNPKLSAKHESKYSGPTGSTKQTKAVVAKNEH